MVSVIDLDDEAVKRLTGMVSEEDELIGLHYFLECLPANADKHYKVFGNEGADAEWVPAKELRNYPWIAINSLWSLEDGGPIEEVSPECYRGVNRQGVALVALDVTKSIEDRTPIHLEPTVKCHYRGRWHFIYRLKKYIPGPDSLKPASPETLAAFCAAVSHLEHATGGTYIDGAPILNPCVELIQTEFDEKRKFRFADFTKAHLSPEELEAQRIEGKKRQAEAGRSSAKKVNMKYVKRITDTIERFKKDGRRIVQSHIATEADMNPKTVYRNWDHPEIQRLLR